MCWNSQNSCWLGLVHKKVSFLQKLSKFLHRDPNPNLVVTLNLLYAVFVLCGAELCLTPQYAKLKLSNGRLVLVKGQRNYFSIVNFMQSSTSELYSVPVVEALMICLLMCTVFSVSRVLNGQWAGAS